MTKTLRQPDPEAIAQSELATAERQVKSIQAALEDAKVHHRQKLARVLTFRAIRADAIHAQAEEERRAAIEKARRAAKAERAKIFDYKLKLLNEDMAKQREAGNTNGIAALNVLIETAEQQRAAALA